jgi:hypothetical protein
VLRERTSAHIRAIARDREYLIARYGADCLSTASQMNRLLATACPTTGSPAGRSRRACALMLARLDGTVFALQRSEVERIVVASACSDAELYCPSAA